MDLCRHIGVLTNLYRGATIVRLDSIPWLPARQGQRDFPAQLLGGALFTKRQNNKRKMKAAFLTRPPPHSPGHGGVFSETL